MRHFDTVEVEREFARLPNGDLVPEDQAPEDHENWQKVVFSFTIEGFLYSSGQGEHEIVLWQSDHADIDPSESDLRWAVELFWEEFPGL